MNYIGFRGGLRIRISLLEFCKEASLSLPDSLEPFYYEVLICIETGDEVIDGILAQLVADRILEGGEAVEFLDSCLLDISSFD